MNSEIGTRHPVLDTKLKFMQKIISIIRGFKDESYHDFHSRIKEAIAAIVDLKPGHLHYTITLEKAPRASIIPFSKEKIALISVQGDDGNMVDVLKNADGFSGSFKVKEALPIAYTKDWADGEPSPGVCLLTLFRQKKGIDYDTFIDRWYNGHTPFTLKVHPIYHYNRNEVTESYGEPEVLYDGIVEEHCKTRAELMNPFKFFAKSGFAPVNMVKTYFDVSSFIDYKSIETYLVTEYCII
jgi:hypothetical protein